MVLLYGSTRGGETGVTASQAVLKGLADDGGLYVPERIPTLDVTMDELAGMTYQETAYAVMKQFLTDYTEEELKYCISHAYDEKFDTEEIAPLAKADGMYFLELFHGKTIAFKDMALSILPYLMTTAAKKNHAKNEIVILTATSGDTGKAAMAGFADVPGTRIIVFYPKNGVSRVQELQMLTQKGANTSVVGIEGNFDDAFSWYNKAAMQGLADGINNVAMYYLEGLVVTLDVDKTINLLESIADKIPVAKINLACIYLEEKGCPQDSEKGMELLRHAVSGEGPAAFTIGKIHLGGMYGAPVDYKIAIKWFEKAYALEIYENVEILCDFYEGLYSRKVKNREKYKLWSDIRKDIAARKSDLYFQVLLTCR